MQKIKARTLGFFVVLFTGIWLAVLAGGINTSSASANVQPPVVSFQQVPAPSASYPPGISAISPRLKVTNAVGGSTPAFTDDDVTQYVMSHPIFRAQTSGQITISQIKFMTSSSLSTFLGGEGIGRPDNALVCYVEMNGTFIFEDPHGTPKTYSIAYEVFDAYTGNLLMSGSR